MATVAASYDARVRAAWATGIGPAETLRAHMRSLMLPVERMRIVNGVEDTIVNNTNVAALNELTGRSCASSPCFTGANGSGWGFVTRVASNQNKPDHCWFREQNGCSTFSPRVDPAWSDSGYFFSREPNAQWLADVSALPPAAPRVLFADFTGYKPSSGALTGVYPFGTIDWGASSNFRVVAGVANPADAGTVTKPQHVTIGADENSATGSFTFLGPLGRTLVFYLVYNSGPAAAQVKTTLYYADGKLATTQVDSLASGQAKYVLLSAKNVRRAEITSDRGRLLRMSNFAIDGSAPTAQAHALCPAPRLALRAANNQLVSTSQTAPNALWQTPRRPARARPSIARRWQVRT